MKQSVNVLGVPLTPARMDEVVALVAERIAQREKLLIGVVNAAKIVNMRRDIALRAAVCAAELILADGMAVVWASRLLRRPLPERVAGIDLMVRMLESGDRLNHRVYLLGADSHVLEIVKRRVLREYPGVRLVGSHHGYYEPHEEADLVREISAAAPDILLVAMSSPRKEVFLARYAAELNVTVCHGVGGAFDVLAGKVRRAPRLLQRLGLEWLYRVLQEPKRLWRRYLVTNSLFVALLVRELLQSRRPAGVG